MSSNVRKKEFPCLRCAKHVKKNDKAVKCNLCELWVHKSCEDMDDETFRVLDRQVQYDGHTFWCCSSCHKFSIKFEKSIKELSRKLDTSLQRITDQEKTIAALQVEVDTLKSQDYSSPSQDQIQKEAASTVFSEIEERRRRKCNVIIHNLGECDSTVIDGKERQKKDLEKLQELSNIIDCQTKVEETIHVVRRLGAKMDDVTRPLLVSFKSQGTKDAILTKAKNLASKDDIWKKVKILQDLTKKQRQQESEIRAEATSLNSQLSDED